MIHKLLKIVFAAIIIVGVSSDALAQQQPPRPASACDNLVPHGYPQTTRSNTTMICRTAYVLLHDNNAKVAAWVAYTMSSVQVLGCYPRNDAFAADRSLPRGHRSELSDFDNSGYDMGHIASNADMSWDPLVARESFILSNIAPQLPNLNRGIWRQLETAVRTWTFNSGGTVTIYAGSIYNVNADQRIGANRVIVPHAFYKIVINNQTEQSLAFIFPHRSGLGNDLRMFQTTVSEVENRTGIRFPVPDNPNQVRPLWHINQSAMAAARRERCRS